MLEDKLILLLTIFNLAVCIYGIKKTFPAYIRAWREKHFSTNTALKRDIYRYKCKALHDKAFNYYIDLINARPVELAYDLASLVLKEAKKQKRVNELYARHFSKAK